jgi:hypothetical protein
LLPYCFHGPFRDVLSGAPGVTRTPGTEIRNLVLYPPELRGPSMVHTVLWVGFGWKLAAFPYTRLYVIEKMLRYFSACRSNPLTSPLRYWLPQSRLRPPDAMKKQTPRLCLELSTWQAKNVVWTLRSPATAQISCVPLEMSSRSNHASKSLCPEVKST